MLNQPIKLLLISGVLAVMAASVFSHRSGSRLAAAPTAAPSQPSNAAPAGRSRSWFSGWFDGMEFNRSPPPTQTAHVGRAPAAPKVARGFGEVLLAADRSGHYHARVEIDGQGIAMLVDTGATVVALRHEDAQRLGILPMPSDYTVRMSTANGDIYGARARLREVRVENIIVADVQAVVLPRGALRKSLLGMSFLRKLAKFEVSGGNLILRP